jgi:hypothetical protein
MAAATRARSAAPARSGNQRVAKNESNRAPSKRTSRESIEAWIAEHPGVCLGAAILLGATLGWMVKRH